jgi:hypothetical protein
MIHLEMLSAHKLKEDDLVVFMPSPKYVRNMATVIKPSLSTRQGLPEINS